MVLEAGWQAMSSVEEGLKATLRLVIDPALNNVTGEYFDGLSPAKAIAQAYDQTFRRRLAALSRELVESTLQGRAASLSVVGASENSSDRKRPG
jgi:hypothetical protein